MFRFSQMYRSPEGEGAGEGKGDGDAAAKAAAASGEGNGEGDKGTKTVLNGDGDGKGAEAGKWPDTWRQEWAGEDADYLKQLERFPSPTEVGKAFKEARARIAQGFKAEPFPEDGTDEDKAGWRKRNGVPNEPGEYLAKLPDGLVIGEEDKPIVDGFVERLHKLNASPSVVHEAIAWYNDYKAEQEAAYAEGDATAKAEVEDALRQEWGGDYRANIHVANSLIEKYFSDEDAAALLSARTPDGKALLNVPSVVKALVQWGRELLPAAAITPSGEASLQSMQTRKAEIEKEMRTNRSEYNKNTAMQAEYRKILEVEQKLAERSGKAA